MHKIGIFSRVDWTKSVLKPPCLCTTMSKCISFLALCLYYPLSSPTLHYVLDDHIQVC